MLSLVLLWRRTQKYEVLPTNTAASRIFEVKDACLIALLVLSLLLNAILGIGWAFTPLPQQFPEASYSPAQQAIEYKQLKFHRGLADDIPIYERRRSPEVDAAWEELYAYAASRTSHSEAVKMANKTWPILGEPGNYVIALDVFHQLHCLDMIRQELFPGKLLLLHNPDISALTSSAVASHGNETRLSRTHLRHCIGAIRQALQCYADTTPVVWQWDAHFQEAIQRDDVVHTCRDFGRIQEWAKERSMGLLPDLSVYIQG
ncbi:hypothetical protein HMN09_00273000 [Mycena chlorophos]|uniref:Cyclochlorotine biosynthesis protein O n=1 Tax=Mycena chlorophos TaxID=658473 RepID=A0A8H6WLP8_MYCCL|nr:hypothetical protein HMN09_00273000 [Mycena chlorophos]